jgi:hypothetical protein
MLGRAVDKKLTYGDHAKFNEAIETVIKMLDRLDHFDRIFVEVPKESKEAEKQ